MISSRSRQILYSLFLCLTLVPVYAAPEIPVLSPQDYITARLKGEPILLLDVRPVQDEFEQGHIPGALHVSMNDFDRTGFNLPINQKIVVTCGCCKWAVCPNAMPAAQKLAQRGFTNVSVLRLDDGISSWTATPLEKGPGLSLPNIVTNTPVQGPAGVTLTIIAPANVPFTEDVTNFTRYMIQILPQLKVVTLSSRSSEGRKLIKDLGLKGLPAAFFDPSFKNATFFSQWLNAGWIKETPAQQGFLVGTQALPPQIYLDRPQKPDQLDIFIMSQCPFGIGALSQTLQAIQNKKISSHVKLNVHYLVSPVQGVTLPDPSQELKGNPSDFFQSLHGVSELEEDVRELLILKYFPDKFSAYFLERSKQPTSSLWENPATVAGIDPTVIMGKYNEEGAGLIQKEYLLSEELGISASPTFLWENTIRVNNVAHLKTFAPLKNLDIQLSGSCNHPKS